jgi:uncharacterized protein YecT (DUF1311 family)
MVRYPSLISKAGGCLDHAVSRLPRKRLREEIKVASQRLNIAIIVLALYCFTAAKASAQSFNCHQATKADEIAICHGARLSSLDEQLSLLFFKLRNSLAITQQRLLTSEQQTWLRERATCGSDASCISCTAANSISIRFYSITSSARAMSFTNGCTLICINAVARKHKRDVLARPQHVEIKRRVKCLKCEYSC